VGSLPYVKVPEDRSCLEIYFPGGGRVEARASDDQSFGSNRIFCSEEGGWAISFDTTGLSATEVLSRGLPAPGGPQHRVAPSPGRPAGEWSSPAALRGSFMHNGAFRSLEAVLDFYQGAGVAEGPQSEVPRLELKPQEKAGLVAFLRALNGRTVFCGSSVI